MDYTEAIGYLTETYGKGKKRGFEVFGKVLACLGNPHESLRIVHVAGTNGKGSACAMLSSILTAAGYKTGMFTSPHLEKFNERFVLDGETISDEDFARHMGYVQGACQRVLGSSGETLSYFENLTALCFSWFCEREVDFLILEAGIGGRLDITNIIKKPTLSVIMSIGLDHTEYLGDTMTKIAREKAGIIKKNCDVVLYSQSKEVYNVIDEFCRNNHAFLYYQNLSQVKVNILSENSENIIFSVYGKEYEYSCLQLSLSGTYQINNALTVLLAVHALRRQGVDIKDEAVYRGFAHVKWHGRMEKVMEKPLFILDGAHNADGAYMLAKSIRQYFAGKKIVLVAGVLKDKDYRRVINTLGDEADAIILTRPAYSKALELNKLYYAINNRHKMIITEGDYVRAAEYGVKLAGEDGIVVCAGSLYLVGDVRRYMKSRNGGIVHD